MLARDDSSKTIGKQVNDRFFIQGYPTLLLIDKSGVIIYRTDGYSIETLQKLEALLHSALHN
jgi:thioredoxin-related protein